MIITDISMITSVFLKIWTYEILPKFWRNIGETFGKFWESFVSTSPPTQKNVRNLIHCAVKNVHFLQNFDNTYLHKIEHAAVKIHDVWPFSRKFWVKFDETLAWKFRQKD